MTIFELHSNGEFRAGHSRFVCARAERSWPWLVPCLALLCGAAFGCSPNTGPPKRPQGASSTDERRSPVSGILRRITDAGAEVESNVGSKWNGAGTSVIFQHRRISADSMLSIPMVNGPVFLSFAACELSPGSLRPLNGAENLNSLFIGDGAGDDGVLADVTELPNLERFVVGSPDVSARGLAFLQKSRSLSTLSLEGVGIDDDVLALIAEKDNLVRLHLGSCSITDEGLRQLRLLTRLVDLSLINCNVTDAGLTQLTGLSELRSLALDGTHITGSALGQLEVLPHLETLSLARTRISDAGLADLPALSHLESLDLSGTEVTDGGLAQVAKLPNISSLAIRNTPITDLGIMKLRATLVGYVDALNTRCTEKARSIMPNVSVVLGAGEGHESD
jgi:hypothetical protein